MLINGAVLPRNEAGNEPGKVEIDATRSGTETKTDAPGFKTLAWTCLEASPKGLLHLRRMGRSRHAF